MSEELEFRISAGLKSIIGKDLITDEFVAVFELVKNSYDAFAKNVVIIVENDSIIIADDGKGMSLTDIKEKWLFVAYSAKKDNTEDKNKSYRDDIKSRRHYAGAKGIGRFSSDRLGSTLDIYTKSRKAHFFERIFVDWGMFEEDQNTDFDKIKVIHSKIKKIPIDLPFKPSHGTVLVIKELNIEWNRENLLKLKHSLEKLINPFSEKEDFGVEIICSKELEEDENGFHTKGKLKGERYLPRYRVNGPVKNAIRDVLLLKTSKISMDIVDGKILTEIIDRGELVYSVEESSENIKHIQNLKIDLFYLNTAAKNNFTRNMGVEPVNFGSIFLYKNGFRVQPYGEKGDDSWGIDYRQQQGRTRFLGTRNLFGRVEIVTDNHKQFIEVSSRDGGLQKTAGYYELIKAFEKAHRRLEKYVVGVLWGEGFMRRGFFGKGSDKSKDEVIKHRESLKIDQENDSPIIAQSNIGSKLEFIQIIKSLTADKGVKILDYNKKFVNLVNEKISESQKPFADDLKDIAKITKDPDLKRKTLLLDKKYNQLLDEKEKEAQKAIAEKKRAQKAEKEKQKAEEKQKLAERKQIEAEEAKRKAQMDTLRKEKERAEEELKRLKAEKEKDAAEIEAQEAKEQSLLLTSIHARDQQLHQSQHLIPQYADSIIGYASDLHQEIATIDYKPSWLEDLASIIKLAKAVEKLTEFNLHANYRSKTDSLSADIIVFIREYIENVLGGIVRSDEGKLVKISFRTINISKCEMRFKPIRLSIVLDNLIFNAVKNGASQVNVDFIQKSDKERVILQVTDNGIGIARAIEKKIFEQGFTTTEGSGLGLYHVRQLVDEMNGVVRLENSFDKGARFVIELKL